MGVFGPAATAAFARATERARAVLVPGDRLSMLAHGGRHIVTFVAWVDHHGMPDPNGQCIASRSLDDLSAWNITKVNGVPQCFRDAEGEGAVAADMLRFEHESAHRRATFIQQRRRGFRVVGGDDHG